MGDDMVTLELQGVAKAYGRRVLFRNVSLKLHAGRCLVVTGRNGAGKTTLLRIIAGLARPSRGEVCLSDERGPMDRARMRQSLGMVAPDLMLYDELTAAENLAFFARLRGLSADEGRQEKLLERVGLGGRGSDAVGTFSSGMKQRLRYAYALQHSPPILLLDEPTSNLDAAGEEMVTEVVAQQKAQGLLVIATNNAEEVRHGDEVLHLG